MPPPIPMGISDYMRRQHTVFLQGATITPKVLTMVAETKRSIKTGEVEVITETSSDDSWNEVPQQRLVVPHNWLQPVINSKEMLPFALRPEDRKLAIIPTDLAGELLDETEANANQEWQKLNNLYVEHRGHGQSTPQTLMAQIDFRSKLSRQLPLVDMSDQPLNRLLYPSSGDIMRGYRTRSRCAIATSGLFHAEFETPEEAAYLVALLNTPALRQAFAESKRSGRHFQLNPWRFIPIPEYDPANKLHQELAGLTVEAEATAGVVLQELQDNLKPGQILPGQIALSKRIRERLVENGLAQRLDEVATLLLPDQVR